jgi:putative ABC transport system substrate-binding protein
MLGRTNRRALIAGLGGAAAWPVVARAQQHAAVRQIGILVLGNADPAPFLKYFRAELLRLGYIEGANVGFQYRSARGDTGLLPQLANELVKLNVDAIVTWQTPPSLAAKKATSEIPIVMADSGDPIATGLVTSLAHPGGNVTGMTGQTDELAAKNVEFIRELIPDAHLIGILGNATDAFTNPFLSQIDKAAKVESLETDAFVIRGQDDFVQAFSHLATMMVDAVMIQPSLAARQTAELALQHHLAAVSISNWFVHEGGLMTYSAEVSDLYKQAASYLDKVLKGANPADLPVQQPTKFELALNLKTAKSLGITVPPSIFARADEVIE